MDCYQVSNTGKVKNVSRNRILIGEIDNGYHRVILKDKKKYYVHRLVSQLFLSNPNNLPCINHKDGNKLNNNVNNLEWCTYSYNTKHGYENGLIHHAEKEKNQNAVLTQEDVDLIRKLYIPRDKEFGIKPLANKFGVHFKTIQAVVSMKTWK